MKYIALIFFILVSNSSLAQTITGTVIKVQYGDTVTLLTADNEQVKIRLAEIDAPENSNPLAKNQNSYYRTLFTA
jgi:endonuclease YncB( thermonuclease family)